MIENLLKDTTFQFVLAICTLVGGVSAFIHITSLLMVHRKLLVVGTRRIYLWLIMLSIPVVLIIAAIGMSRILGNQNFMLGAVGFALCSTTYLIPSLIKLHWQSQSRFLAVIMCAFSVPLMMLCALAMFSAAYFSSIGPAPDFALQEPKMWSIFTLLEVLHLLGILYVYKTQPSIGAMQSNPPFKGDALTRAP